ncbi:FAD-binding oxidoreductase [Arthrobacter sp. TMN-37]
MPSHDGAAAAVLALNAATSGEVIDEYHPEYDSARRVWNAMIDRRPAAILRVAGEDDIAAAIRCCIEHQMPLAVRGGGHSVAGNGTVDGGIVLDLGALSAVDVDADRGLVRIGGGATLAQVDAATEPHGLAVPLGVVSATGVGGLTLGGGMGWLTRPYGLSIDNLVSARVITASGEVVEADDRQNPDLFWGLRGGGGNFGVVSSFTFRAHRLPRPLYAGNLVYTPRTWETALAAYAAWTGTLPDELTSILTFITPPPHWEMGSDPLMVVGFLWAGGDQKAGEALIEKLRAAAPPEMEEVGEATWTGWQSAVDELFPRGVRAYWRNAALKHLSPEVQAILLRRAAEQTWQGTAFDVHHMGGALARVPAGATAFPDRQAPYWLNIYGFWTDDGDDGRNVGFVKALSGDIAPHAAPGRYVNFMGAEEPAEADPGTRAPDETAVYRGEVFDRLTALKTEVDPRNVFRLNHNVAPR